MSCRRPQGKTARTNVRMVYLGKKPHLGRRHRVLFGKEQFELENTICAWIRGSKAATTMTRRTLKRTAIWALDSHIKIPEVVIVWSSRYSGCRVCHKALRFLETWGKGVCTRGRVLLGSRTLMIRCNHASVEMDMGQGQLDKTYLRKSHRTSLAITAHASD